MVLRVAHYTYIQNTLRARLNYFLNYLYMREAPTNQYNCCFLSGMGGAESRSRFQTAVEQLANDKPPQVG